jgi:hypothetical protein
MYSKYLVIKVSDAAIGKDGRKSAVTNMKSLNASYAAAAAAESVGAFVGLFFVDLYFVVDLLFDDALPVDVCLGWGIMVVMSSPNNLPSKTLLLYPSKPVTECHEFTEYPSFLRVVSTPMSLFNHNIFRLGMVGAAVGT